jgi:hypothetical protein
MRKKVFILIGIFGFCFLSSQCLLSEELPSFLESLETEKPSMVTNEVVTPPKNNSRQKVEQKEIRIKDKFGQTQMLKIFVPTFALPKKKKIKKAVLQKLPKTRSSIMAEPIDPKDKVKKLKKLGDMPSPGSWIKEGGLRDPKPIKESIYLKDKSKSIPMNLQK